MRRLAVAAVAIVALLRVAPADAETLDRSGFRHERELSGIHGGPALMEPDGQLFAGSRPHFGDLRVLDAEGSEVPWRPAPADLRSPPIRRAVRTVRRREVGARTEITLDFGVEGMPVDEVLVSSSTRRYERTVVVSSSTDGRRFGRIAESRISRFGGEKHPAIPISTRERYLRIEVENGDDNALRMIKVSAISHSRVLLLEGGHPAPYLVLYGNPVIPRPRYDFARIPVASAELRRAEEARLGRVRPNPDYVPPQPPPDTRSFVARHDDLVTAALGLAAIALGGAGLLALRRPRRSSENDSKPRSRPTG
jgi:hypothetical protein